MEIVTGSTGQVHVTSIDDAVRNGNPGYLNKRVVLTFLENFAYTIVNNNQVKIGSGYGMNQGRIFKIDEGEFDLVTIESGSQGYKRSDIIAARYTMNTQSGFEDISLVAIRGASGTTYTDPSYTVGNINQGATLDDMPLYRVKINGLVIESVERMFTLVRDGARLGELEKKVNDHMTYFNKINVRTNLASEGAPLLKDGGETGDIRPGVQGTLPASHGGTGQTTLKNAGNSILNSLDENNTNPTNDTYFIGSTASVSGFQKKKISSIWNYILGKIRTQLGLTNDVVPISHGGTGKTSVGNSKILVGSNGAFVEKTLSTTLAEASNDKIPTTKAVADELETRGYGDMTKATFCNANTTTIALTHGGTGATTIAGARNALKLGNTDGPVPIENGGTGAINKAAARASLEVPPINHASTATTYGIGNANNYGHVKLTDNYIGDTAHPASSGVAPSSKALSDAVNYVETAFLSSDDQVMAFVQSGYAPKSHASTATTYGIGNASNYGHVKLTDSLTSESKAASGVAASAYALKTCNDSAVHEINALGQNKAPKNHASTATTYGIGNASNYGHVKLTDTYNQTGASYKASAGIAASAYAVGTVYSALGNVESTLTNQIISVESGIASALSSIRSSYMPKAGGTFTGAIKGTSATFSSNIYSNSNVRIFGFVQAMLRLTAGGTVDIGSETVSGPGTVRIFSQNHNYYGDIEVNALSSNQVYNFPTSGGTVQVSKPSSRRVKENIHDMTEDRAKKLLDLDIVSFDYIGDFGGGLKDQCGVIAEDAVKVIPEAVEIPKNYDESKPIDKKTNPTPSVDYRQYIPYLIKMVQMQQKEIEELKAALNK